MGQKALYPFHNDSSLDNNLGDAYNIVSVRFNIIVPWKPKSSGILTKVGCIFLACVLIHADLIHRDLIAVMNSLYASNVVHSKY